jgi:predicted metalloprotease with PDZ domain
MQLHQASGIGREVIALSKYKLSILVVAAWAGLSSLARAQTPITLDVDASGIANKIISAHEVLSIAGSREITLVYPKWIPGDHGPTGPIADLVNLHFSAHGKAILWRRDPVDMYAFHLSLPADATEVIADFSSVNVGYMSTPVQGDLNFNRVVLYPANIKSDDIRVRPSVVLPSGWKYATTLPDAQQNGKSIRFGEVSLTTLIDSPIMMGALIKEFNITPKGDSRQVFFDLFAETPEGLDMTSERVEAFRNLVSEAGELFGARHYASYRFLVEEHADANDGLEHHQSSDNQVPELGMISDSFAAEGGYLLAHEFIHSWNGKYRRPAGLVTANYQEPMKGELLWVYEGLTSYLGEVLATRSGLDTLESFQDRLADDEAEMDYQSGRAWRSLGDTGTAAQLLYTASSHWEAERRSNDYYTEGRLLWLEVDSILHTQSGGNKSIDDFAHAFYGPPDYDPTSGPPKVVPYTFQDVVTTLNALVPYDWNAFFRQRLDAIRPEPPTLGLVKAGWHVVYTQVPSEATKDAEATNDDTDLRYSIGLRIGENGEIIDVLPDSAAGRAGVTPESKITAVNHRVYSKDLLISAIALAQDSRNPISVTVLRDGYFADVQIDYHAGLRYPHLEPIPGKVDLLPAIAKPRRH